MRGAILHAPGDVRVEEPTRPDDHRTHRRDHPARRHLRLRLGPVALPRHRNRRTAPRRWATSTSASSKRSAATCGTIKPGQFVVGSFFASDNTCEICRAGYQSSCVHRERIGRDRRPGRATARPAGRRHPRRHPGPALRRPGPEPARRVRRARHRLVRAPSPPRSGPGKTVAVVGDGAVGLLGVLAAKQLGAERIIAMSRHDRPAEARPASSAPPTSSPNAATTASPGSRTSPAGSAPTRSSRRSAPRSR